MDERRVAVVGARSIVGRRLLPMLSASGWSVVALSRRPQSAGSGGVEWLRTGSTLPQTPNWVYLAPIWTVGEHLSWMHGSGVKRIVALSSTSRFTKKHSRQKTERAVGRALDEGERALVRWSESQNVRWLILQPTLIYDPPADRNVSDVARFVRRYGFFPLVGDGSGLRQPIHAADVAHACIGALTSAATNRFYTLSGGETLRYADMVKRIFEVQGLTPRFVKVPYRLATIAVEVARLAPRYRHLTPGMLERMEHDLVFDHSDAKRDLVFTPRSFDLAEFPKDV